MFFCLAVISQGQSRIPATLQKRIAEQRRENRFEEAIASIDLYLDSIAQSQDKAAIFEARLLKADFYRMKGQYDLASKLLDSLTVTAAELKSKLLEGQFFTILGTLCLSKGELTQGRISINKAIDTYTTFLGEEDTLLAPCYNKLGNYYYFIRNYDSALYWYSKALDINANKRDNLEDQASYLQNLGIIYLALNEYSKAEYYFIESLNIKESIYTINSFTLGRLYLNLGLFYNSISAFDRAIVFISKAETIFSLKNIPAALEFGSILWNKGLIYHLSGESELALDYLFNARKIIDSVFAENQSLIASLNADIANVYKYTGNYGKAIYYYNKSLSGADTLLIRKNYRNLANLYNMQGNLEKAGEYFRLLLETSKDIIGRETPENGLTFFYYGYYLLDLGNDSSLVYLDRAFGIFNLNKGFHDRDLSIALVMIGDYYFKRNEYGKALEYYHRSLLAISPSYSDTNTLVNPPAESFYPDIRITTSLYKKARCLTALHIETRQINLLIAAARTYQLCFDLIDQLRMTLKAENSQLFLQLKLYNIYKQAIDNCFTLYELTGKSSWAEQAFEISERSKSIILLSELKDANAKKIGSIPEEYLTLEREVRKDINLYRNNILVEENQPEPDERKLIYLRSNLLTLEKKFDSLKNSFELNYPVYYRYKYDQSVVSPDQLKDILGKNEIMLEYSLSDKYLYIFLISRKKFEVKRILTDETLVRDIFSLRDNLDFDHVLDYTYDDYLEYQIVAHKLYTKLIQPFSNDLVNKKIIIIPDGELNYLSFESLLQKITPSDTIAFRYLPFLIKSNPISYAPSATIYSLIKKRGRAPGLQNGVLALAPSNTMLTRSILANEAVMKELLKYDFNLPGATHEAESILQVMKGRKLIGEDATEYEFKKNASQFDILHFATHTVIDDENPLSSTLSFYPYDGHDEDGMLHTYEIYNLELKGELAVLSACSTGNGKLLKGEGVISLARAFTYAGMPSVIMTLWDVEDISTGNIIPYFYHLLGKGYGKDIALRQAKLAYLGKTIPEIEMHPAFWSGFVLYGNNQGFRQKADHLQVILLIILAGLLFMISFIIIKRYIQYRKKLTRVDTDLSTEFQPEDRF